MHSARSGDSTTWFKARIETVYLDPFEFLTQVVIHLHGSTQVMNTHYLDQVNYLGQDKYKTFE